VFSKLDLTNAYDQNWMTLVDTALLLRLMSVFGMKAPAEMFQNASGKLLSNSPGARNLSDDIIVHAKTQAEHYGKTQMYPTSSHFEKETHSMLVCFTVGIVLSSHNSESLI